MTMMQRPVSTARQTVDTMPPRMSDHAARRPSNITPAKLLVIDGQALIRRGFALALQLAHPQAQVLEAANADDAVDQVLQHSDLSLILLDVDPSDGVAGLRTLVAAAPNVPVVAISAHGDSARIVACVNAGARGYVLKASPYDVLDHVVSLVLADPDYLPLPRAALLPISLITPLDGRESQDPLRNLTERQRDVFRLLQEGQSNKEIARDLGVLEGTVKVHVRAIMQKLGARNRTQVAVLAMRNRSASL